MAQAQTKPQSFVSVLDMPARDIERPKPMPVGEYICVVQGQPRFDKSSKKQTDFVEFDLKYLKALDSVDEDALKEVGGIKDKNIKATYYLTEAAVWRLKDFIEHCGIETDGDESLRQLIAETPGKQLIVTIRHEASQDGSAVFARVGQTAPVA